MCQSMVNIQSPTAEIRRGKKRKKKEEQTTAWKYNMVSLFHRATINKASSSIRERSPWICAISRCLRCCALTFNINDNLSYYSSKTESPAREIASILQCPWSLSWGDESLLWEGFVTQVGFKPVTKGCGSYGLDEENGETTGEMW